MENKKLFVCDTCKNPVAFNVQICPHCGRKYRATSSDWILRIILFVIVGIPALIMLFMLVTFTIGFLLNKSLNDGIQKELKKSYETQNSK